MRDGARQLGVSVNAVQAAQMARGAEQLQRWNRRVNLTAITDGREMAVKHFVDALAAIPWLPPACRLLDVGTGAGFPGLPIRIVRPDIELTLIDRVRKKVSFVRFLASHLGLTSVAARHMRLETLAAERPPKVFDAVVCRALGPLERWLEAAVTLLAPQGRVVAYKGPAADGELPAAGAEGSVLTVAGRRLQITLQSYRLPVTGDRRTLVCLHEGALTKGPAG